MAQSIVYKMGTDTGNSVSEINKVTGALQGVDDQMVQTSTGAEKLAQSLEFGSAVAGSIAAVQGAMGLLGIENEKAMKTISRLMQLQAIAGGLQQGANLLLKENIVITKLKVFWMKIRVAWMTKVISTQAVMTLGLSLLVAGLVASISAMKKQSETTDDNTKSLDENSQAVKDAADEWKAYTEILKQNSDIVERIEFQNGEFQKTQSKGIAALERELKMHNAVNGSNLKRIQIEKDIIREKIKLNNDAMLLETDQIKFLRKEKDLQAQLDILNLEQQKERDQINFENEQKRRRDENAVFDEILIEKNDSIQLINNDAHMVELESTKKANKLLEKENKRYDKTKQALSQKEIERNYNEQQMRLGIATQTVNGLMSLTDMLAENSSGLAEFQKALALFQIGIDTASAISRINVPSPLAVAGGPLAIGLERATNVAMILGNMAKAKQLLSSVQTPTMGGGGSATMPSLSADTGSSSPQTQTSPFVEGSTNDPGTINPTGNSNGQRVYVLSSDITDVANDIAFVETVSAL